MNNAVGKKLLFDILVLTASWLPGAHPLTQLTVCIGAAVGSASVADDGPSSANEEHGSRVTKGMRGSLLPPSIPLPFSYLLYSTPLLPSPEEAGHG